MRVTRVRVRVGVEAQLPSIRARVRVRVRVRNNHKVFYDLLYQVENGRAPGCSNR